MKNRIDAQNISQSVRMPPQNNEAEMSVLGSLMLDKDAIYSVVDVLSGKDFYK
ncbi:MAG: DnaB-like helicase N-terminal domain-containing protein, partial [Patescibacteria group bacterium]